ncbi:MAG: hypothetical protein IJY90_03155 [Clostridia bacterium]|nr:hypothetical protein [Clostridia bacterium]
MKYSTKICLYNSYFDLNNRLSAQSILSIFQDVASVHGEEIGVGYQTMLCKKLYWVLSRIKFDILKMPQINQTVVVETWPHVKGRIDFDRDFKILSEDGQTLVVGTSKWCVIDTENRTLQRTDNVNYVGEYCLDVNYAERFGKIVLPMQNKQHKFTWLVGFSDLDHNGHMNNTKYANLILNVVENKYYTHFEINFLNECLIGDELNCSLIKTADGEYVEGEVGDKTAFLAHLK